MQDSLYKKTNSFGALKRIPKSEGFSRCLKSKTITNHHYKLFFTTGQMSSARLGIIASKKCMHRAADRNLNKRVIREIFRTHSVRFKKLDIVVLIRNSSPLTIATQKEELANLFSRLEALCA